MVAIIGLIGIIINSKITKSINKESTDISKQSLELSQENQRQLRRYQRDTIKSIEQQRIIDAISSERIDWLNEIRNHFALFNKYSFELNITSEKNNYIELMSKMKEQEDHIMLLLNTTEVYNRQLVNYTKRLSRYRINIKMKELNKKHEFEEPKQKPTHGKLIVYQQVLLKSEWKRIKRETELGRLLTTREMNKIYVEVRRNFKIDDD